MLNGLTGWHAIVILVIVLLLFGAPKLPALARSLGQSMKILKSEIKPDAPKDGSADSAANAAPDAQATDTTPKP